jgi:hypothetical protein
LTLQKLRSNLGFEDFGGAAFNGPQVLINNSDLLDNTCVQGGGGALVLVSGIGSSVAELTQVGREHGPVPCVARSMKMGSAHAEAVHPALLPVAG